MREWFPSDCHSAGLRMYNEETFDLYGVSYKLIYCGKGIQIHGIITGGIDLLQYLSCRSSF